MPFDTHSATLPTGSQLRNYITGLGPADFRAAAERIAPHAIVTPLIEASAPPGRQIRLKCENLQKGGSFKIRCAANVVEQLPRDVIARGAVTASAGNFAPSVALAGAPHGMTLVCHVPTESAAVKLAKLRDLGVELVFHEFDQWWRIMETRDAGAPDRVFLHPVCEPEGIVGNATIALELVEQWPEIDTVVVPFGGGGLVAGIAAAMRAVKSGVKVYACEIEHAAPLAAAFNAGAPVVVDRQANFSTGPGKQSVLAVMWPLLSELLSGVVTVTEDEAKAAFRDLTLNSHLVVEAQSAVAYAAARSSSLAGCNVAAILSGGNIDRAQLASNLAE